MHRWIDSFLPPLVTALFCISEQHDGDSFLNESTVLKDSVQFNDSLLNSDLIPPTVRFNFTLTVFLFFIFFYISMQRFMNQNIIYSFVTADESSPCPSELHYQWVNNLFHFRCSFYVSSTLQRFILLILISFFW